MSLVSPLFSVPCSTTRHPAPDALNQRLRELFLAREAAGAAYANPTPLVSRNQQLFESSFNLFDWPEECVQELRRFCWSHLYAVIGEINGYDTEMLKRLHIANSSWFHITRRGGYFALHNHAMASWSGVYCVSPGTPSPDHPESGALTFVSPHASSMMFVDNAVSRMKRPYSSVPHRFFLEPGQLLLFPSWLLHEVLPYHGDGERITVAFNCWFRTV